MHDQRRLLFEALQISLVIDVGANIGQYAGVYLREWTGYRGNIVSFEPVGASYEYCASQARFDDKWTVEHLGLSDTASTLRIYVPDGASDLSSIHPLTSTGLSMTSGRTLATEEVQVRRLDDVIGDHATLEDRIALKIDVQGHEAAVLRGGRVALQRVALLECEMPLVALYEDQESFLGLLTEIDQAGFVPVGMRSNYIEPVRGVAVDADFFFVQKEAMAS